MRVIASGNTQGQYALADVAPAASGQAGAPLFRLKEGLPAAARACLAAHLKSAPGLCQQGSVRLVEGRPRSLSAN
jgi:hypothetical protein